MLARAAHGALCAAVLLVPLAGCGGSDGPEAGGSTTPGAPVTSTVAASPEVYVATVEAALRPAGRLAAIVADRTGPAPGPSPEPEALDALLASHRRELRRLAALPLSDPVLVAQRDRLVAGLAALTPEVRELVGLIPAGDPARLRSASKEFFSSLKALSSAIRADSPPSPPSR